MMTNETNQLSEREQEILRLVATGLSNQQIAYQLGISINTVKVHLRNVFGKIGVASRTEATMYAVRNGIITIERPVLPAPDGDVIAQPSTETSSEPHNAVELPATPVEFEQPATVSDALPQAEPATQAQSSRGHSTLMLALAAGLVLVNIIAGTWLLWQETTTTAPPQAVNQPTTATTDGETGTRWTELPGVHTSRAAFALATVGERIYVVGGENEDGVLASVERYDARSQTWTELTPKPTPVADVRAVVLGGKLYVPGGRLAREPSAVTTILERYDPNIETWERLADLPQPRSGYALAALEGKLYVIGGWDGRTYRKEVFEYDPNQGTWHERTPMPTARAFADAGVVEGSIYVIGGENETGTLTSNEVYTPAAEGGQPWTRRAPSPQPRSRYGTAVALSTIYLIGGEPDAAAPLTYDVRTDSWQTLAAPPQTIGSQPGVALIDTTIMVIGGKLGATAYSNAMQGYQALYTISLPSQQR